MIFRIRHAFSCDLHTLFEHMTLFRERGWRFWTLPGWDGKLEPELSSISILSSWMNALYLLKWSSFKVKSSLWWLRCGALQESHCHSSYLLHKKWRSNPGLGWGNWTKQSSKVQRSGELPILVSFIIFCFNFQVINCQNETKFLFSIWKPRANKRNVRLNVLFTRKLNNHFIRDTAFAWIWDSSKLTLLKKISTNVIVVIIIVTIG